MARLDPSWVVSAADYERVRSSYGRAVSSERTRRRLRLGRACSLQFETREFALWHVQELLRVEGWTLPRVLRTIDDVQPWCPAAGELVGTVMVDTDDHALGHSLARALAIPGAIVLRMGTVALRSETVEAGYPGDPVWYLRWRVGPHWNASLASGCTCTTRWDDALRSLPGITRAALASDLMEAEGPGRPMLHHLIERTTNPVGDRRRELSLSTAPNRRA